MSALGDQIQLRGRAKARTRPNHLPEDQSAPFRASLASLAGRPSSGPSGRPRPRNELKFNEPNCSRRNVSIKCKTLQMLPASGSPPATTCSELASRQLFPFNSNSKLILSNQSARPQPPPAANKLCSRWKLLSAKLANLSRQRIHSILPPAAIMVIAIIIIIVTADLIVLAKWPTPSNSPSSRPAAPIWIGQPNSGAGHSNKWPARIQIFHLVRRKWPRRGQFGVPVGRRATVVIISSPPAS